MQQTEETIKNAWTCRLQAASTAVMMKKFDVAEEWHNRMIEKLSDPDTPPLQSHHMRNYALYTSANLAAHRGDMESAWKDFKKLDAQEPSLFGTHTFFKDHFIQRLRLQLLAAEDNLSALKEGLENFLPPLTIIAVSYTHLTLPTILLV